MPKDYILKARFSGDPDIQQRVLGSGSYATVNDEEYRIVKVISPTKYIIQKDQFFGGDQLVLEKLWGGWRIRERDCSSRENRIAINTTRSAPQPEWSGS